MMNKKERLELADYIICNVYDGDHHKQWLLDQILRKLLLDDYECFIEHNCWDIGIPP